MSQWLATAGAFPAIAYPLSSLTGAWSATIFSGTLGYPASSHESVGSGSIASRASSREACEVSPASARNLCASPVRLRVHGRLPGYIGSCPRALCHKTAPQFRLDPKCDADSTIDPHLNTPYHFRPRHR